METANSRAPQFTVNLLTIPANVFHIITLLLISRLSEWLNERTLVSMIQNLWTLPCIFALRFWPQVMVDGWGTYAVVTVLLSYPYCHAIVVAWTSRNSSNVGMRTVSAALYNMMVQCGNVISNNIYQNDDKPLYHRGNRNLLIINFLSIGIFLLTKVYYVQRNKQRERVWDAMTAEVCSILMCLKSPVICVSVLTLLGLNSNAPNTYAPRPTRGISVWTLDLRTRRTFRFYPVFPLCPFPLRNPLG